VDCCLMWAVVSLG